MTTAGRTVRRVAPAEQCPLAPRRPDYVDAFELRLPAPDTHTAEQWARKALEDAPPVLRGFVRTAHRHVLRLELGPVGSRDHVHGWLIEESTPDLLRLAARSPLLGRGAIVGRRVSPSRMVVTTFLFHDRPLVGRALWALVGPLHRRVAPLLLERAADAFARS